MQEKNLQLVTVFIDFMKAFCSITHKKLWSLLGQYGIPHKIIRAIRAMYKNANCKVNHQGYLSEAIPIGRGLKQGCVLSPLLFNICLDKILEKTITTSNGIPWEYFRTKRLADLEYADDICLLSYSMNDMRRRINSLEQEEESIALKTNVTKTRENRASSVFLLFREHSKRERGIGGRYTEQSEKSKTSFPYAK